MMFAITFDLKTDELEKRYHVASWTNAYTDIRKVLVYDFGFVWKQRSVYFGSDAVDSVTCGLAVRQLARLFPWFAPSIRDIRILRIEEFNDLRPMLNQLTQSI